ncbi:MAG: PaaI family thioesterase [Desulfobacterales bacterium]|nr:PaaI family thioesterase [Desulfobacterales bacterium]
MDKNRIAFLRSDFVQGFPAYCGFTVDHVSEGRFETSLSVRSDHRQQDGFVHAGVIATMADHTAGYAAYTLISETARILSIEFKINFFKPAVGSRLICRSVVISPGKSIIVAESNLYSQPESVEKHVARATVTLMAVDARRLTNSKQSG